jgi:hypothetical protein
MPHHCAGALNYQYHGILDFMMSPEGGRLIDVAGAMAGIYAVAPRAIRRGLAILYWTTTFAILALALSDGKGSKVAHQLSPCFSAPASANAAPELISTFRMKDNAAPTTRGGFFLLLALMFSLLSMAFREQQCNPPR